MLLLCFLCFHIHYRIYNKLLLDFNFLNYATLYKDSHDLIGARMPSQLLFNVDRILHNSA